MKNTNPICKSDVLIVFILILSSSIAALPVGATLPLGANEDANLFNDEDANLFYNGEVLLKFHSLSDDEYAMTFTNIEGTSLRPILVNNENVDGPFKFDIIFKEAANQCDFANGIKRGEEFLLSNAADSAGTTYYMKYNSADTTNRELTFTENHIGNREVTYELLTETCSGQQIGRFNLIIAGTQYKGYINTATSVITLSLNNDQTIDGDKIKLVTKEGFVITMPDSISNGEARVTIAFPSAYAHNDITISLLAAPANEVDARVNGVTLTEKQQGDMLYKYALLSNNLYVLWEQETDTRDPPTIYLKKYVQQNQELEEAEEQETKNYNSNVDNSKNWVNFLLRKEESRYNLFADNIHEGETKTYTINGVNYRVELLVVKKATATKDKAAKFIVNRFATDEIEVGESDIISTGDINTNLEIIVKKIFVAQDASSQEQRELEERRQKEKQQEQREMEERRQKEEQDKALQNNEQEGTITPPNFPGETVTSVSLNKGWNLVSLGAEVQNFLPSDCSADKKLVSFIYISDLKKYVSINEAREILGKDFGKYFEQHSFWVYSYSDCVLKTTVKKVSVEKLFLDEGWNLLSIPKTFSGKTFVDIQNSCDVLSAYAWKSDKQQWYAFEDQQEMQDNGQGIIVKVDKSCIMQ